MRESTTPLDALKLAIASGIHNAAIGFSKVKSEAEIKNLIHAARLDYDFLTEADFGSSDDLESIEQLMMGAKIFNLEVPSLGEARYLQWLLTRISAPTPFLTMKADYLWSAYNQLRNSADPGKITNIRGFSWREFRVLAAILSAGKNRYGFTFLGWESISVRASGFASKSSVEESKIPQHAPLLSRKQIRATCDRLEQLKCFTRYRHSKGSRGGLMAYSFRHSRVDLAKAVWAWEQFNRNSTVTENRARDLLWALEDQKDRFNRGQF